MTICILAPSGWACSRQGGHEDPCAMYRVYRSSAETIDGLRDQVDLLQTLIATTKIEREAFRAEVLALRSPEARQRVSAKSRDRILDAAMKLVEQNRRPLDRDRPVVGDLEFLEVVDAVFAPTEKSFIRQRLDDVVRRYLGGA